MFEDEKERWEKIVGTRRRVRGVLGRDFFDRCAKINATGHEWSVHRALVA